MALRAAVAVTFLVLLASWSDFRSLAFRWDREVTIGVVATIAMIFLARAVAALRWSIVVSDSRLGWRYMFRLYLIGDFFSLFLPTSVGGDGVRAVALARTGMFSDGAVTGILLDRALGVAALVAYLTAGLILAPGVITGAGAQIHWIGDSWGAVLVIAALGFSLSALLIWKRYRPVLRRAVSESGAVLRKFSRSPARVAATLGLSLVVQGLYIGAWAVLAGSMDFEIGFRTFFVTVPVVSLVAMLPVTISGLGLREGAWAVLLAQYGITTAAAVGYSLLYFASFVAVGCIGGAIFTVLGTAPNGPGTQDPAPNPIPRVIT